MPGIAALALAYVLSQFFRSFLAVLSPVLISELGATKSDLALASGAFFLTFGLMQFAVGVALDKYGPRRTCSILFGTFAGSGAFVFASAQGPGQLILAMALTGIACAPVLMASYFIFARSFPASRFAVLTSWLVAFGLFGNVISASPLAWAAGAFGWRSVMLGIGAVSMALAALVFFLAKDPQIARGEEKPGMSGYLTLMKDRRLWPLIPMMVISYAPVVGIRGLWAGPYLHDVYGADAAAIGTATLWMAFGMIAGGFLYGPADRLFKSHKWVIFGGNLVSFAAMALLAVHPVSSIAFITVALTAIGLFGLSYGLQMAQARSFMSQDLVGRGVTLMNFFNIFGVGMMQFATGAVVKSAADAAAPQAAYSALFGFYAVLLALALVIFVFSKDAVKVPAAE